MNFIHPFGEVQTGLKKCQFLELLIKTRQKNVYSTKSFGLFIPISVTPPSPEAKACEEWF